MVTKEQLVARLARRLDDRFVDEITLASIKDAISSSSAQDKDRIVTAVRLRSSPAIGMAIASVVAKWARDQANAQAEAMLATDALNLQDLAILLKE